MRYSATTIITVALITLFACNKQRSEGVSHTENSTSITLNQESEALDMRGKVGVIVIYPDSAEGQTLSDRLVADTSLPFGASATFGGMAGSNTQIISYLKRNKECLYPKFLSYGCVAKDTILDIWGLSIPIKKNNFKYLCGIITVKDGQVKYFYDNSLHEDSLLSYDEIVLKELNYNIDDTIRKCMGLPPLNFNKYKNIEK